MPICSLRFLGIVTSRDIDFIKDLTCLSSNHCPKKNTMIEPRQDISSGPFGACFLYVSLTIAQRSAWMEHMEPLLMLQPEHMGWRLLFGEEWSVCEIQYWGSKRGRNTPKNELGQAGIACGTEWVQAPKIGLATSLSETKRKSQGKRPAVAKGHAAGPPRAPRRV